MKKLIAFMMIISFCMANISAVAEVKELSMGDYVVLGSYNGEPIVWRYVLDDENGKLMLSDRVLCKKPYDSVVYPNLDGRDWGIGVINGWYTKIDKSTGERLFTEEEVGSHARAAIERIGKGIWKGNNYWGDSNIRSWLNSSAAAGEVKWLCGIPPEDENFKNESGFLSDGNFSEAERLLIKPVVLATMLDQVDSEEADYAEDIETAYRWFSEYLPERIFLLNLEQIQGLFGKADEFREYIVHTIGSENYIWLRDALPRPIQVHFDLYYGIETRCVKLYYKENDIHMYNSCKTSDVSQGILPAFYLNEDIAEIVSGNGTEANPYVLRSLGEKERYVSVTAPVCDITINGVKLSSGSQYPAIEYNGIEYLPMTTSMEAFLGIKVKKDDWFKSLELNQTETKANELEQYLGKRPIIAQAKVAEYFLTVENRFVYNSTSEYPFLIYNNVLYLPLTWSLAHDVLGWDYSYDSVNGLAIDTKR